MYKILTGGGVCYTKFIDRIISIEERRNKEMKEKGFTLIELLAVIVILAIIAIIAVPIILNIINDTKKSSVERNI